MAKLTEIKPGAAGFGQRRFVVRGPLLIAEATHAALRVFYDEYPERIPLNPNFPQPGRRGGSRPAGQAAGPPGAEGVEPFPLPQNIFPAPRERTPGEIVINPNVAPPATGAAACPYPEGDTFSVINAGGLATMTTETLASPQIIRPFVLARVQLWHSAGNTQAVALRFRIAQDNLAPASLLTTGDQIPIPRPGGPNVDTESFAVEFYPNRHFRSPPYFFKLSAENLTALTIDYGAVVDVIYLA